MPWQQQFHSEHNNVQVLCYLAASEEACRRYFRERVSAKLAESKGGESIDEEKASEPIVAESSVQYGK